MIISTTSTLDGKNIKEYRGIVFGQAISGIDFYKDFGADIANVFGGRVAEYEQEIVDARADAINEMVDRAKKVGANALIGVSIDVEPIGGEESGYMLMVTASGTAVVVND